MIIVIMCMRFSGRLAWEWFLRVDDPWRIALSTDHPNGGSFLAYPQIIALLMDHGLRTEAMSTLPGAVKDVSGLCELSREYTLSEIAIITRAGPAQSWIAAEGAPWTRSRRGHHHLCPGSRQAADVRLAAVRDQGRRGRRGRR